jgi:hypothetical protein
MKLREQTISAFLALSERQAGRSNAPTDHYSETNRPCCQWIFRFKIAGDWIKHPACSVQQATQTCLLVRELSV